MSTGSIDAAARRVLTTGAGVLARGGDLDAGVRSLLEAACGAVGADLGAVFLADPEAGDDDRPSLSLLATCGFSEDARGPFEAEVAADPDHPVARAAVRRTPALGRGGTRLDGTEMTGADLPLLVSRDGVELALGIATFGWAGAHEIPNDEAALLLASADLIAAAVDRERLVSLLQERSEWLERIAYTDPLTGLANGHMLDRILELELVRAARQDAEVSVAVFDVDGFAALNDAAGRDAGDDVLRRVAEVLGGSVRMVDTIARNGADEFVVVAPGSAGSTVARRILVGVAARLGSGEPPVTVSAGVARFPADGTDREALLASARHALEDARQAGGGRIATAPGASA
jgi:diguanylate cyclase (GGDEF)-like protein